MSLPTRLAITVVGVVAVLMLLAFLTPAESPNPTHSQLQTSSAM